MNRDPGDYNRDQFDLEDDVLDRTIAAIEWAADESRSNYDADPGAPHTREHKNRAALLDALAKALSDLTSDEWWISQGPWKLLRPTCAEIVRRRLKP